MPTFTPETGAGLADATSYVSDTDAVALLAGELAQPNAAAWEAADAAAKQAALVRATRHVDTTMSGRWKGTPLLETQALAWPREGVEVDGRPLAASPLPSQLQLATAVMAVAAISEDLSLTATGTSEALLTEESVKVGPISETLKYAEPTAASNDGGRAEQLEYLLSGLYDGTASGFGSQLMERH